MNAPHVPRREPAFTVTRTVTPEECHWLDAEVPEGTRVYAYWGATYGCVSGEGVAVTKERGVTPFFELPRTALIKAEED